MCALGRYQEAKAQGETDLVQARAQNLGHVTHYVRMPLAVALSKLGQCQAAARDADAVIEELRAMGCRGLNLFLAYEARAMVALAEQQDDLSLFEHYCGLAKDQLPREGSEVLAAKYQRLVRMGDSWELFARQFPVDESDHTLSSLKAATSPEERASQALSAILEECGAGQGFLFALEGDALTLVARHADHDLPAWIEAQLGDYVAAEAATLAAAETTGACSLATDTGAGALAEPAWDGPGDQRYRA